VWPYAAIIGHGGGLDGQANEDGSQSSGLKVLDSNIFYNMGRTHLPFYCWLDYQNDHIYYSVGSRWFLLNNVHYTNKDEHGDDYVPGFVFGGVWWQDYKIVVNNVYKGSTGDSAQSAFVQLRPGKYDLFAGNIFKSTGDEYQISFYDGFNTHSDPSLANCGNHHVFKNNLASGAPLIGFQNMNGGTCSIATKTYEESGTVVGNPSFMNEDGGNYSLQAGSPAIDAITNPSSTYRAYWPTNWMSPGLNDVTFNGVYTGNPGHALTYLVKIDGTNNPNTFTWSNDMGLTWEATGVQAGSSVLLSNGIVVSFGVMTGHTLNDQWMYTGFNWDANGNLRDSQPDIGAYEYASDGDTASPAAPGGLRVQ
jgi:hypothetical protein